MKATTTCYICGQPATSRDHVPPKSMFPKAVDMGGVDYRTNLLTVPSCAACNEGRSDDDQYALCLVAFHFENNPLAYSYSISKIFKGLRRSGGVGSRSL